MARRSPPKNTSKRRRTPRRWAYLAAVGTVGDVMAEIGEAHAPEEIGEGLVLAQGRDRDPHGHELLPLAFPRQAMATDGRTIEARTQPIAEALRSAMVRIAKDDWPWTLQVLAPVSKDPKDPRKRIARDLDRELTEALEPRLPRGLAEAYVDTPAHAERIAQVWLIDRDRALVGFTAVSEALSVSPGGPAPEIKASSRGAQKLETAVEWLGVGPGRGEICVDLGVDSRWFEVAHRRGAQVIAVGAKASVAKKARRLREIDQSPFEFVPEETADWLISDMPRRPREVIELLGKWGRRVWARQFIVNLKLPMKHKVPFLKTALEALSEAGWRGLRARQLFTDRQEVTISGWLEPKLVSRGWQPPFQLRSRGGRSAAPAKPAKPRPRKRKKKKTTSR